MKQTVVLALQAPGSQSLVPERQCRAFWTACASCNRKENYPIEDLNRHLVCHHCNNPFTALEVSRPRNQATSSANVAPPRKKVKMEGNVAHGEQWPTKIFKQCDILLILKDKGKRIVENIMEEIKHQKAKDNNYSINIKPLIIPRKKTMLEL